MTRRLKFQEETICFITEDGDLMICQPDIPNEEEDCILIRGQNINNFLQILQLTIKDGFVKGAENGMV